MQIVCGEISQVGSSGTHPKSLTLALLSWWDKKTRTSNGSDFFRIPAILWYQALEDSDAAAAVQALAFSVLTCLFPYAESPFYKKLWANAEMYI